MGWSTGFIGQRGHLLHTLGLSRIFGMLNSPDDARDASPISHIQDFQRGKDRGTLDPSSEWPPIILAHGGCECTPYVVGARNALEEFRKAGDDRVRIYRLEEEAHVSEIVRAGLAEDAITPFVSSVVLQHM
jgi:hypothetical protein